MSGFFTFAVFSCADEDLGCQGAYSLILASLVRPILMFLVDHPRTWCPPSRSCHTVTPLPCRAESIARRYYGIAAAQAYRAYNDPTLLALAESLWANVSTYQISPSQAHSGTHPTRSIPFQGTCDVNSNRTVSVAGAVFSVRRTLRQRSLSLTEFVHRKPPSRTASSSTKRLRAFPYSHGLVCAH
jgi:hypothetical protein